MTLVATILSDRSTPFMISDTLLSSNKAISEVSPITYPTKPEAHPEQGLQIVGISQKIVEIIPNLLIGWSGSYAAAGRFISNLRLFSRIKSVTHDSLSAECEVYFNSLHPKDIYHLSIITLYYKNGYYSHRTYNSAVTKLHDHLGQVTVIGSGSRPFLDYISKVPLRHLKVDGDLAPSNANMIEYCLAYVAQTQNYQKSTGFGIEEGWGGGFELVLSKSGGDIQKLDRVVYFTFVWWFEGTLLRTSWVGSRYFSYSSGAYFNILSQERHKALKQHVAVPPDYPMIPGANSLNIQQRIPQFACLNLENRDTRKSRVILEYAESGLLWCGISPLPQIGESIRVNLEYLEGLIRVNASEDAV